MSFDAKYLSTAARKVCRMEHMTPREFDRFPGSPWSDERDEEVVVLEVRNSKRTLRITNRDLTYAEMFDGPGRPKLDASDPTERFTVTLPNSLADKAAELGNGNMSAGVRRAIEAAKE